MDNVTTEQVHFVALDSMVWFDGTGPKFAEESLLGPAQLAFLDKDLAAVNRSRTPWVVVTAHAPLCTMRGEFIGHSL